ncbi:hypothetical protein [Plantactinospora sp. GCM10030261]|uniref:hypothetical protein n=1 Tax=Plantactinospora sp. GCM10030261 TaxID=3273420 RepID=UPI0036185970
MTARWARCRRVARTEGAGAALRELGITGPGRYAIVPAGPDAPAAATDPLLTAEGLALVRRPDGTPEPDRASDPEAGDPEAGDPETGARATALALAWLRLGLSERLLDDCLGYLDGRTTGGEPLLGQQLVKGELAEIRMDHLEVAAVLDGAAPGDAHVQDAHRRITTTDRTLLRLLGASGFVHDGPGRTAYASELLADTLAAASGPAGGGGRDV